MFALSAMIGIITAFILIFIIKDPRKNHHPMGKEI